MQCASRHRQPSCLSLEGGRGRDRIDAIIPVVERSVAFPLDGAGRVGSHSDGRRTRCDGAPVSTIPCRHCRVSVGMEGMEHGRLGRSDEIRELALRQSLCPQKHRDRFQPVGGPKPGGSFQDAGRTAGGRSRPVSMSAIREPGRGDGKLHCYRGSPLADFPDRAGMTGA